MSAALGFAVVERLLRLGVQEFAWCSGSRNASLLTALSSVQGPPCTGFVDERAAAFFALGRAKKLNAPVAVITTSGTAAFECLPALVEASMSGVPLIVVSADRPVEYAFTGAPQCVSQVGMAKAIGVATRSVSSESDLPEHWNGSGPEHWNVHLREPLLSSLASSWSATSLTPQLPKAHENAGASHAQQSFGEAWMERLRSAWAQAKLPVLVVGELKSEVERRVVERFALHSGVLLWAEAASGLREYKSLQGQMLWSGERQILKLPIDCVLRMGGVPTLRLWRELDTLKSQIPVFSISELPFPGLQRGFFLESSVSRMEKALVSLGRVPSIAKEISDDRVKDAAVRAMLAAYPRSEPSLFARLSRAVSGEVFLGNSLPVRFWDWLAPRTNAVSKVWVSRGANGIDGLVSQALALSVGEKPLWALVGDQSAVYDMNALQAAAQLQHRSRLNLVVVNNGGGRIFDRLSHLRSHVDHRTREDWFVMPQQVDFGAWAQCFGVAYERWDEIPPQLNDPEEAVPRVIEVVPDLSATTAFWREFDGLW